MFDRCPRDVQVLLVTGLLPAGNVLDFSQISLEFPCWREITLDEYLTTEYTLQHFKES